MSEYEIRSVGGHVEVYTRGQVPSNLLGRDIFQEVDITGITMPITKSTYLVRDVTKLADTVREAMEELDEAA